MIDDDEFGGRLQREPARARRRRDRQRMLNRAYRVAARRLPRPARAIVPDPETLGDLERRGIAADWASLARLRDSFARRTADHLAKCSCWMCGNPRRLGERTLKERAVEEIPDTDPEDPNS